MIGFRRDAFNPCGVSVRVDLRCSVQLPPRHVCSKVFAFARPARACSAVADWLGPQFVQTTIGGRVSASNVAPGAHDGRGATNTKSRAVGFHAFQSGLVQAVEVHKSPRADHIEGGLGGFVDIQPRKPFDLGER